jgi:hypothetical protein
LHQPEGVELAAYHRLQRDQPAPSIEPAVGHHLFSVAIHRPGCGVLGKRWPAGCLPAFARPAHRNGKSTSQRTRRLRNAPGSRTVTDRIHLWREKHAHARVARGRSLVNLLDSYQLARLKCSDKGMAVRHASVWRMFVLLAQPSCTGTHTCLLTHSPTRSLD